MGEKTKKWPGNKSGRYYVDENCIDCDACRTEAPENFVRNDEHGYSYVHKQPDSPEEEAKCEAAKAACPVEAIGSDGDEETE